MLEPEILGNIVRKHRKSAGLSQLQLAEMAGVGKTVVYDIEKGKQTIKLNTLRKILYVLNIKVELTSPIMHKIIENEKS